MTRPTATLYRMVMPEHLCPYGLKSKHLLERQGYEVDDHHLETREQTDAFKREHGVETTPQTFIDGERIGGYDALKVHFGIETEAEQKAEGTTYQPVIAVFAMAALMGLAATWMAEETLLTWRSLEWFVAFSMCILAILKLQDLSSFSSQFLGYDLLARRDVRYAYFYPFAEGGAGVLMIAGEALWLAAPLALFVGSVGAVSVIKAVYVEKRELRCACVGGDSNVPLGAISLTENLMMVAMGVWMLARVAL
ncbi:MAG: glutaredoxin [Acidobacteria bacterium]|nr:MAG: glutaredoxin [Acidobacteriota bacterium]REK11107.1 MAG: glutaredoxin [Acidobacteriota bacterium]